MQRSSIYIVPSFIKVRVMHVLRVLKELVYHFNDSRPLNTVKFSVTARLYIMLKLQMRHKI